MAAKPPPGSGCPRSALEIRPTPVDVGRSSIRGCAGHLCRGRGTSSSPPRRATAVPVRPSRRGSGRCPRNPRTRTIPRAIPWRARAVERSPRTSCSAGSASLDPCVGNGCLPVRSTRSVLPTGDVRVTSGEIPEMSWRVGEKSDPGYCARAPGRCTARGLHRCHDRPSPHRTGRLPEAYPVERSHRSAPGTARHRYDPRTNHGRRRSIGARAEPHPGTSRTGRMPPEIRSRIPGPKWASANSAETPRAGMRTPAGGALSALHAPRSP